jgi:hypothetical protein
MNTSDIRARIVAVLLGITLFFALPFVSDSLLGENTWWYLVLSYGASGVVLGFIWPNMSWRLGLWLFAIWPPMLVLMLFFSDPQPVVHWKREILGFLGFFLILPGASTGAWLGSLIARRVKKQRSGVSETLANSGASGRSAQ